MPSDQAGSVLPTVRYPSFLKSTRSYPRWHKVVHHTYVFIFFLLVVVLPILHATSQKHRPSSWELWAIFGTMLGVYVLYRAWLYFVYQGGYDSTPAFMKKTQTLARSRSTSENSPPPPNQYPTLASIRQDQIAAFMPSSYPSTPRGVRDDDSSAPPPIYQTAIQDTPVPEYSPAVEHRN